MALTSIKQTINKAGHLFKEGSWEQVIKFFEAISENSIPLQVPKIKKLIIKNIYYLAHGSTKSRLKFPEKLIRFDEIEIKSTSFCNNNLYLIFFFQSNVKLEKKNLFFNFLQRAKNLKFDVEECVTKCVVQLLLIGIIRDMVDNFLPQLSDEVLNFINPKFN